MRSAPSVWTILCCAVSVALADPRADYASLKKLHDGQLPSAISPNSNEHLAWVQQKFRTLHDRGMAFIGAHPDHPLRWDVLVLLKWGRDHHIVTREDGSKGTRPSPTESALWNQEYHAMLRDLLASRDASSSARHQALLQLIDYHSREVRNGKVDNPRNQVLPEMLEWVRELHRLDPRSGHLPYLYLRLAWALNAVDPELCRTFVAERLALHRGDDRPDPAVRTNLANFQRLMRNQDGPAEEFWGYLRQIDATFTDPAVYRDKMVIVAYLPVDWTLHTVQLEEAYRKYRGSGLEIIQIIPRNDSATAPVLQRDRSAMERHIAAKGWGWRVVWEVARGDEDFYKTWGLPSYPGFLVLRDGRFIRHLPAELKWDEIVRRELNLLR